MTVVEKCWGREHIRVNTDLYCFKQLYVEPGQRCSLHRHVRKDETFVLSTGKCILEVGGSFREMVPGEKIRIFPGTSHRFGSYDGCVIIEVSTHHDDKDVVRIEPSGLIPDGWGKSRPALSEDDVSLLNAMRSCADSFRHRIVLATGCFDVLHAGHESLLRRASELGDRLVVAINSDESVQRRKGAGRPIVPERQRADLLRALRWVDRVVVFNADDPRCVAEVLRPDVVVKGDDWRGKPVPEADGAMLVFVPELVAQRTTAIVDRVQNATSDAAAI